MKAIGRSLSSCLEVTRMWRSTERASLEKKPSMRLSHDPCVGVNVKVKRPIRRCRSARLEAGFLVVRNDGEGAAITAVLTPALLSFRLQHRHLPVDPKDLGHLGLELGIALFQVVAHPRLREGRLLCGLTSCSAKILHTVPWHTVPWHTVPWASLPRLGCPADGPCCRACAA